MLGGIFTLRPFYSCGKCPETDSPQGRSGHGDDENPYPWHESNLIIVLTANTPTHFTLCAIGLENKDTITLPLNCGSKQVPLAAETA